MRTLAFYFALALAAGAQTPSEPQNAPAPAPEPNTPRLRTVEVPLLDCSGLPCIEMATGSDKSLKLLLDLAEPNSYLDLKTAHSLDASLKPMKGSGDSDLSQVQQTTVPGARIGDLPMGDFPFLALDTSPQPNAALHKSIPPFPADGALGFRAFENRILQIDYPRHIVRLSEPLGAAQPCPQTCTDLMVRHFGNYGPVTLTTSGFAINDQALTVQLDTQFTGTMLIYPDWVKKLGLKKLAKAKHKEFFPWLQGGLQLAQAEGATETYQSVPLGPGLPVYFFDSEEEHTNPVNFDATVGSGVLSRGVAVFDMKGKHFWLETSSTGPTAHQ